MSHSKGKLTIIFAKGKKRIIAKAPLDGKRRIVLIINNQFTNAPNTTQIASGAGRNSAAGNNAAIDSSNTQQQQSVGADGKAKNLGMRGKQSQPDKKHKKHLDEEVVIVINNQVVKRKNRGTTASATQVASGSGKDSTGGTNSAIGSSNTKQQHAVGGSRGSRAINKGMNSKQKEFRKKRRRASRKKGLYRH
ncbi:hypothetical protein [Brevibacillus sp. SYSU BS000544]|uniref:hypothetical protein n=1 Tax=Brevibacillus sp. SYSU BS000544 TaxID=3416443 RepID=UPI003CE4CFBD